MLSILLYNGKEEVWRTADKLGNLYESPDFTDRIYYNSRLEHDGKRSWYYYYDCEGNLILKSPYQRHGKSPDTSWQSGSWAYEWNANGSLKSVKRVDGKEINFTYDAFGRRIGKNYGNREFLYIWDGNVTLHEIKKEGKQEDEITTWVFEGFTPTAKLVNGKSYSIISDYLGTPLQAIDSEGKLIWERELDIYGRVRKEKGEKGFCPFRYQGQYFDSEVDLCYNRFRYYDPSTGIYISQDPIGLAGGILNLYSFVSNSNTWVDIFGLDWVYQIVDSKGNVKYYGITERSPVFRGNEHIDGGNLDLKQGEKMQIIAKDVNHDQARTIEAIKIREKLRASNVDRTKSIAEQLKEAGLRNKNRGRDIEKRPFDPDKMGGEYSLLDKPEDVNGFKKTGCSKK
ncbi:hypothetical protein HW49_03780 [Porphyromonadaceae bacterium COT-184 OH4590]|nr:hypothetical protein HW49_03780 [Porphyromonadaceae bacterium COT-184 OH4590]